MVIDVKGLIRWVGAVYPLLVYAYAKTARYLCYCTYVCVYEDCQTYLLFFCRFFVGLTSTFQLLDKPWSQVSSLPPPGTCLQFLSCIGFSIPTARRLPSNLTLSRFPRVNLCTRKSPYEFIRVCMYALGGTRTHEIDLWVPDIYCR